ncbi:hypothetical protein F3Y22_tig00110223pilonHSYRG00028 [Hibiscus syriacus]|uniref:Uncharacterized protein n=1 Tax=Hibiscus syriacus TaxID=106335 RepID=A0A6A3B6J9_HIBSY|nr:hypothetical protein F3Y22_tig00110223pilonHSYRG00028 [Hibiscus syriacus]
MTRSNPEELLESIDPEIERLFRQRRRAQRVSMYQIENQGIGHEDDQNAEANPNAGNASRPHAIRDHLNPILDDLNPGIVALEIQAAHFELKPIMFNILNSIGQFGGMPNEYARQHIRNFLEVCDSFCQQGVHEDVLKLKFFPYSLRDRARAWLSGVPASSMIDIASFRQADDESMYECWDRYKALLRKCSNHGFQDWTQVVMFYNGVNASTRMMLDVSANGTLLDKSPAEAFDILDMIAANDYQFPSTRLGFGRKTHRNFELDSKDNVSAQLAAITNMLKNLQRPSEVREVKAANSHPNFSWENQGTSSAHQPARQQNFNDSQGYQSNMPWHNSNKGGPSSSNTSSLEATMQEFIATTKIMLQDHSTSIKNQGALLQSHSLSLRVLESQVGQIVTALQERRPRHLPSDTEVTKPHGKEQCSMLTLRSGTQINLEDKFGGTPKDDSPPKTSHADKEVLEEAPEEEDKYESSSSKETEGANKNAAVTSVRTSSVQEARPPPPFPQRLKKHNEDIQFKKFVDILSQLQINIPFLEATEQMPTYAKFLKKIVTKKRKIEYFIIPCSIGDKFVGKALCDLGSSVNLMPKSIFVKLGIGNTRPTSVILQLADRSHVRPEGRIEDAIVKVDKFVFPIDFLILDCEVDATVPIILGRPFLATGRILIDCERGELTMRMADQHVTVNVFQSLKYMDDYEECQIIFEVSFLKASPGTHFESLYFEEFVPPKPSLQHAPTLELKNLPRHQKYAYLGSNETLPVIISSALTPNQESSLLSVLSEHKKALGWTMADLKGISPTICMHKILLEECHGKSIEPHSWVSPVQCVPKKGGMTVVMSEDNELIPTCTVTRWRICMDYRKLNKVTKKDHFPFPFIDQMLDRLAGKAYYCFLDGYSGMPFGLCNGPVTFQRCMQAIFSDMVEDFLEIFMDDFSVSGDDFQKCLEGIILGHKISEKGIEVNKANIKVIEKLPPPNSIKGIRSFLGHAGFYRRFIKDFSTLSKPLCTLLQQNQPFVFDQKCHGTFKELKQRLISAPIVVPLDWTAPFELMCDASDFAVGVVLGQRRGTKVIVHTDHSAIKYLVNKKDAKSRLIRWILLLQEFDLEVIDRKGTENQVADHLSRLENTSDIFDIKEEFPDEKILYATIISWYADLVNVLVSGAFPYELNSHGKKRFLHDVKFYFWDKMYLFKQCADQMIRRCVPEEEQSDILHHCHTSTYGGHFGGSRTAAKAEVSNREVKQILEKVVNPRRKDWSPKLDEALWAYRTEFKIPLGMSPFKMIYGKACHIPEFRALAYENAKLYKEKTKKWHDRMLLPLHFHAGQKVLLFNSMLKLFPGKLKSRWSGPFEVHHVYPYGAVDIKNMDDRSIFKVNGQRLKAYQGVPPTRDKSALLLHDVDIAAEERYQTIKNRRVFFELGFFFSEEEDADLGSEVLDVVTRHKWKKFAKHPAAVNATLVKEFYSNITEPNQHAMMVHGISIRFTPTAINRYFKLQWNGQQLRRQTVDRDRLFPRVKLWNHFMKHKLLPTSHNTTVSCQRMILLHSIISGLTIDIGKIIVEQDHLCLKRPTSALVFPNLITALWRKKKVQEEMFDEILSGIAGLNKAKSLCCWATRKPKERNARQPHLTLHHLHMSGQLQTPWSRQSSILKSIALMEFLPHTNFTIPTFPVVLVPPNEDAEASAEPAAAEEAVDPDPIHEVSHDVEREANPQLANLPKDAQIIEHLVAEHPDMSQPTAQWKPRILPYHSPPSQSRSYNPRCHGKLPYVGANIALGRHLSVRSPRSQLFPKDLALLQHHPRLTLNIPAPPNFASALVAQPLYHHHKAKLKSRKRGKKIPWHKEIAELNENVEFDWHFENAKGKRIYFLANCLQLSVPSTREIHLEDTPGGIGAATAEEEAIMKKTLVPHCFELKKLERECLIFLRQSHLPWYFSLTSQREWRSEHPRGASLLGADLGGRGKHWAGHVEGFLSSR